MNTTPSLFDNPQDDSISLKEAADALSVSTATIRNWIKEGLLTVAKRGYITMSSFISFKEEHVGKSKLVSRANKLHKSQAPSSERSKVPELKDGDNIDMLGEAYEQTLTESYRNQEGIYYTPIAIVNDMLNEKLDKDALFLDPCCGSGNFLVRAIELGIRPENIYGFDTDPNAVQIAKQRIESKTGKPCNNIVCGDFLESADQISTRFKYIYTNPPWGKKISKEKKKHYASVYNSGDSSDTSSLFYFAASSLLEDDGTIGFLLPEAVLNIGSFEDNRKALLNTTLISITDYGKPFKGVLSKAYAIVSSKTPPDDNNQVTCRFEKNNLTRSQSSFNTVPKHIFNIWANENEAEIISRVFSFPHITLANHAQWGLGIVTGNNTKYCMSSPFDTSVPVYRGKDITKEGLLGPFVYIDKDFSQYQQVAPMSLYLSSPKLIYRFISDKLVFYNDNSQSFVLNSANLMIPDSTIPVSSQYLADYFNSDFANWLFNRVFHTHKILRGDLELMPIFSECNMPDNVFCEQRLLDYLGIDLSVLK